MRKLNGQHNIWRYLYGSMESRNNTTCSCFHGKSSVQSTLLFWSCHSNQTQETWQTFALIDPVQTRPSFCQATQNKVQDGRCLFSVLRGTWFNDGLSWQANLLDGDSVKVWSRSVLWSRCSWERMNLGDNDCTFFSPTLPHHPHSSFEMVSVTGLLLWKWLFLSKYRPRRWKGLQPKCLVVKGLSYTYAKQAKQIIN